MVAGCTSPIEKPLTFVAQARLGLLRIEHHLPCLRGDVFVTDCGIEGGQVTGHGLHVSIGQVAQFLDHIAHGAGGNTVRFGVALAQIAVQLGLGPRHRRT